MFGVVLWNDASAGKAVFWCEDQGDLAYYEGPADDANMQVSFAVGDMVAFDVKITNNLRKAYDARLIGPQVYRGVQDCLRQSAAHQAHLSHQDHAGDNKVVPLKPRNNPPGTIELERLKA